jgi:hypothetical protein
MMAAPLLTARLEVGAALVLLTGLTWLLRGGRAALKMCAAIGAVELVAGLAVRSTWLICASVVTFGCVAWSWRITGRS